MNIVHCNTLCKRGPELGIIGTWLENLTAQRRLSPGAKAVLGAVADNPEQASYCSAAILAEAAGVNVATVVRAAQAIGFSGWPELSTEVRSRFLSSLDADNYYVRNSPEGTRQSLASLNKDRELIQLLSESLSEEAITGIAEMIAEAQSTTVLATGSYAAPGAVLAHNGQGLGYRITLSSGSATSMINSVRMLQQGDCLLTFSIWKTSASIVPLCEYARAKGIKVIVIADQHSRLAELADRLVLVPSEGAGPMASVTCAVSVVQCIVTELANLDPQRSKVLLEELQTMWTQTGAVISD